MSEQQTFRVKCLTTGNESSMFDVGGSAVSFEHDTPIRLELGFFDTANTPLNLIYWKQGSMIRDWLYSLNKNTSRRPLDTDVFGILKISKGTETVYSRQLTFGDCEDAYITNASFASGTSHVGIDIPASTFGKGSYLVTVESFVRWFILYDSSNNGNEAWQCNTAAQTITIGKFNVSGGSDTVPVYQSIRVALDSLDFSEDAKNLLLNDVLKIHAGNAAKIQIGLFRNGEIPSDLLEANPQVQIVIKDTGGDWYPDVSGGVVVQKSIQNVNGELTREDWESGNGCHAEVVFTSDDLSITPGIRWICVNLVSGDSTVTFYSGRIYVLDNGISGATLIDALAEMRSALQEALDARDMMRALVDEQTNPTALYERVIAQLNSALVTTGNRIYIGADRGLYMLDDTEGGDGLYHKIIPARLEGVLQLTISQEGVENVN